MHGHMSREEAIELGDDIYHALVDERSPRLRTDDRPRPALGPINIRHLQTMIPGLPDDWEPPEHVRNAHRPCPAHMAILTAVAKGGDVLSLAELAEAVDLPDLEQHLESMRRLVQRVWIPGEAALPDRGPNGVALTQAGSDLMRQEALSYV